MPGDVQEHPAVLAGDDVHRQAELDATVAPQRPERVAGEALRVEADEYIASVSDVAADHGEVDVLVVFERADLEWPERSRQHHTDRFQGAHRGTLYPESMERKRDLGQRVAAAQGLWFVEPRHVRSGPVDLPALRDGDVLVRTTFSGISAGTELLAYRGQLDPELPLDETIGALGGTFRYPFRYGYSCVGVVEESRGAVPAGTRVFAFQPHQDRFVTGANDVVPLGAVDDRSATLFPLVETAVQITLDAGTVFGERVVVFGLGAVGALTSLLLRRAGADVLAVEPRAWRRDLVARFGVVSVDPEGLDAELTTAGGHPTRVPLVIEVSGNPDALRSSLSLLGHEGTVLVASWYGTKEVTLPLGAEFHRRRLTLRSTQVSTIPARLGHRWTAARRRATAAELMDSLPLADLATHTFAFDDAADAYSAVDAGREGLIHVALGYH